MGKTTLLSRLIERPEVITEPTAATTRDRHYGKSEWNGTLADAMEP